LLLIAREYEAAFAAFLSVVRGTIWVDLYRSVCALRLGMDQYREIVTAWGGRVAADWHSSNSPGPADLLDWVRRHHPLSGNTGDVFFGDVANCLEALVEESPRVASQARE